MENITHEEWVLFEKMTSSWEVPTKLVWDIIEDRRNRKNTIMLEYADSLFRTAIVVRSFGYGERADKIMDDFWNKLTEAQA